jgi:hypothetical protein
MNFSRIPISACVLSIRPSFVAEMSRSATLFAPEKTNPALKMTRTSLQLTNFAALEVNSAALQVKTAGKITAARVKSAG